MSERKVLIRHHVFVKKVFQADPADWLVDLGLTFQPHEMHVRSVVFTFPPLPEIIEAKYVNNEGEAGYDPDDDTTWTYETMYNVVLKDPDFAATVYMEGIGDICCVSNHTDRVANYIFQYGSTAKSMTKFEFREISGKNITKNPMGDPQLILHLEFIKYA